MFFMNWSSVHIDDFNNFTDIDTDDDGLKAAGPIMFSHTICITLFKCVNFPIILRKIFQKV